VRRRDVPIAFGLGLVVASVALAFVFASAKRGALLVLLAAEIVGGREPAIPAGIARGLSWQEAATATTLIELTSLFLLFPVLVGLASGLHRWPWLESTLRVAQRYAQRRPDVDVLALCGLTLAPFLPIGALSSVLVGEMLRLPSRWLLPGLAVTLVIANVSFAFAVGALLRSVPHPALVAGILSGALLLGAGVAWLAHRRADREAL
jgi:uncharacterized membrane protein